MKKEKIITDILDNNNISLVYKNYENSEDEKERYNYISLFAQNYNILYTFLLNNYKDLNERSLSFLLSNLSKSSSTNLLSKYYDENINIIINLLYSNDFKSRKNMYIALGNLEKNIDDLLEKSIDLEDKLINYSSLILCIGKINNKNLLEKIIKKYNQFTEEIPLKVDSEIKNSIKKAMDKQELKIKSSLIDFPKNLKVLLKTLPVGKDILEYDLKPFKVIKKMQDAIIFNNINKEALLNTKSFYKAYIYEEKLQSQTKDDLIKNLISFIKNTKLSNSFSNNQINYRIDYKGKDKNFFLENIQQEFENAFSSRFYNNPSNYEIIFFIKKNKENFDCLIDIFTSIDNRFSYRKETIPASINPVTANILSALTLKYITNTNNILDPFCGSATMLIEMLNRKSFDKIVGVDINKHTTKKAIENINISKHNIDIDCCDFIQYDNNILFQNIFSNLPYGVRVGSHNQNTELYKNMFKKINNITTNIAIISLLTTEISLIKNIVRSYKNLSIVKEYKIETGGLFPTLFIIKKNN